MTCTLQCNSQDLFKSMAIQIEIDKKEKELLAQQLQKVNDNLHSVHKMLAHKDNIICSLEADLEHIINQMNKLHGTHNFGHAKTC